MGVTSLPHPLPSFPPSIPGGTPGRLAPGRPEADTLARLVGPRLTLAEDGSLWAALLDRDRLRLVVPLRDRAPAARDEDAEDRALLALLDAVGVPDVALVVPRRTGMPRPEDCRLWRRARSGSVGLRVRVLGVLVVGDPGASAAARWAPTGGEESYKPS